MVIYPWLKVVGLSVSTVAALYCTVLLLLLNVGLQRHALYAHKIKPWWQDLDQPDQWGFLKNQVRPFKIQTPDGEALYAWHILPIAVYAKSEVDLILDPTGSDIDVTKTTAFRLLKEDPESRLVISFHGNAGTVCQGWRTDTYRALSAGAANKIHVLTVDYRGFGYSTGSPSEEGLIIDGITLVDWALHVAGIPSERIVIVGQSLGTAVATAVVEYYTEQSHVEFAGVVLMAAFSKIPELMLTYAAGSIVPILSPLRIFPKLQRYIAHRARDTWNTEARLGNIIRQKGDFNLVLIHAINDYDIQWTHSDTLFHAAANATSEVGLNIDQIDNIKHHTDLGRQGWTNSWPATTGQNGVKSIRQIILRDGGHNRIMTYAPVTKAVFELFGPRPQHFPALQTVATSPAHHIHILYLVSLNRSTGVTDLPVMSSRISTGARPGARFAQFKLVLLGESAVGKSSLVLRFVKDQFDDYRESTIGAAFLTQTIALDDSTTVKFEIWDTAGQERYKSLAPMYYRNANCAVVVYDITQASSLDKAKAWVKELQRQANENIIIALAGNKLDLVTETPDKRAITASDAEAYAREAGLLFFETSAKTSENVRDLFTAIARKLPLEQAGARNMRSNPRPGVDLRPEAPGTQGAGACSC